MRRLELEEELARGAHYGARQMPYAAEGPDQRGKLVHAVVYLEIEMDFGLFPLVRQDSTWISALLFRATNQVGYKLLLI